MELILKNETGAEVAVKIGALKVRDYPAAFAAWDKEEEWKLVALATEPSDPPRGPDWVQNLVPESYEQAVMAMVEANPGFFAWCGRRLGTRGLRDAALGVARSAGANSSLRSPPSPT